MPSVIVGYSVAQTSNSVNVSNASGYRVNLKTTNNSPLNSLSLGNVSAVAPNGSSPISATLATGKGVGAYNQAITLIYADDSTLAGASSNLGTAIVTIMGNVLDHAASTLSISGSDFGRVMRNSSVAVPATLCDTLAADRAGLQITSMSSGSMDGVTVGSVIANGGSMLLSINANTAVTGTCSSSYTIGLSDDQSIMGWTNLPSRTFQLCGTIVDKRVVTASAISLGQNGRFMAGQGVGGTSTLSTTGGDDSNTRVTVNGTLFNSAASTSSYSLASGTYGLGAVSGAVNLPVTGEGLTGEGPYADVLVNYSGTAVDNRVVTASPVNFGLLHVGQSSSGSTTLSTIGDNNHFTAVTVPGGTNGVVTVANGSAVFNADGVSEARSVTTAAQNSAGVFSSSVVLSTNGEGLSGEVPIKVSVPYSVQVFSGSGLWTGNSSNTWSGNGNWTDANQSGVQAAPGTWGYNDTAVLADTGGSGTTITLDGASPTLAALSFNTTTRSYTLAAGSGGTLNLSNGTKSAVLAASSGANFITAPIILTSNVSIAPASGTELMIAGDIGEAGGSQSLTLNDSGTLILSGTDNSYSGGTYVETGTLAVNNAAALPYNQSLTISAGGAFIFDPLATASSLAASQTASPDTAYAAQPALRGVAAAVPEPGTLALLVAGLVAGFAVWRRRRT